MKKIFYFLTIILFAFCFPALSIVNVEAFASEKYCLEFKYEDKLWQFFEADLIGVVSAEKKKLLGNNSVAQSLEKIVSLGFSEKQALTYCFDNIERVLEQIAGEIDLAAIDSEIILDEGKAVATEEVAGRRVLKDELYSQIFSSIVDNSNVVFVETEAILPDITQGQNALFVNERGSFVTYINGVNQEGRIHNIKTALSRFDGKRIEPQEVVSFNEVIKDTTENNGYAKAKVILNGKYVDDFGGGVCQAATTLYNALLLSDIEVLEANPHSLKVGYVAGSFDAMVSYGSSDLVFKNNTAGPLFISTYCTDYECGVKIYGEDNLFEIKRVSEKLDFDAEKNPNISSKYQGFLEYYLNDELIENRRIRSDAYFVPKIEKELKQEIQEVEQQ